MSVTEIATSSAVHHL